MTTHKAILLATLAAFALLQLLSSVDGVRSSLPWTATRPTAASTGEHAAAAGVSSGVPSPPPPFPPSQPPPHRLWGSKRGGAGGVPPGASSGGLGRLFRLETPLDAARALALVAVASLAAYVCCRTVMPHGGDEPLLPLRHSGGHDSDDGEGEHGEGGGGSGHAGAGDAARQAAEGRRVPRVVCLHGWRASAAFMEHQLLVLGLGPADLQPTFLQAPKECAEAFDPMVVAKDGEMYHYWFDFADDNGRTTVDEQSHDLGQARDWVIGEMAKLVASSGQGIDGILGFSQGACVAAEVVATLSAWRADRGSAPPAAAAAAAAAAASGATPPPSLLRRLPRFAVCLSGVCPEALLGMPATEPRMLPVPCPSFHTVGRRDPYAEQSEGLCDLFSPSSATLVRHDGGHEFATEVPVGQQLRVWLGTVGRHASRFLSAATVPPQTQAQKQKQQPPPLLAQQQQQQLAEEQAVEELLSSSGGTRHRRTHEHENPDDR